MLLYSYSLLLDHRLFPATYADGCRAWLARVPAAGQVTLLPCSGSGPMQSPAAATALVTQTLWLGPASASRVLVLIAGTHGVEGYAGSAIQLDLWQLMTAGQLVLAADTALLAIHALNPWGYAWDRRCDGEGIDLNRNFVDFSAALPANPGYQLLREGLLLAEDQRSAYLAEVREAWGNSAFEVALSGGQYCDANGPFYGGRSKSHGRRVIESLIVRHQLAGRRLAVVDIHTGLGSYGYGEVICDHAVESPAVRLAQQWYGPACTLPAAGTSSSVPKVGLLDYAWHEIMGPDSCFVTLEFGTLGTAQLFAVLLAESHCWAVEQAAPQRPALAARMREHFCPADPWWREAVLFRARQVITQSLVGLSQP